MYFLSPELALGLGREGHLRLHLKMAATGVTEGPKLFQGVARNDFAFKLLKQMGWEEGMGLGKEKQGIKTHIRVRKNVEQSGVGLAEARKQAADWTINTSIYDRILANLKVKSAGEGKQAPVQSESESESEEDNKEKKKQIEGETAEVDVKRSKKRKASKEEPSVAAEEVEKEQPRKLARHVGRYKKREASKSVAGYASHHLQEILVSTLRMITGAGQTITIDV
jgi:Pin2-interacting protein X1